MSNLSRSGEAVGECGVRSPPCRSMINYVCSYVKKILPGGGGSLPWDRNTLPPSGGDYKVLWRNVRGKLECQTKSFSTLCSIHVFHQVGLLRTPPPLHTHTCFTLVTVLHYDLWAPINSHLLGWDNYSLSLRIYSEVD